MITLTNGHIQSASSIFVPNGSIVFQLNVDATVIAAPGGFVAADIPVVFQLDANGDLIQPAKLYSNEELQPQLSPTLLGTYYLVTVYTQAGARLNAVPMWWQFPEIAGSTVDISQMTPISTVGTNVIFYPTNFSGGGGGGGVTSVTFTGDGTILSATPSAPVTTIGTLTATLLTQSANLVLAGPATGAAAFPTFRALVAADIAGLTSTPGGATTDIQINLANVFYGDGNFTYNPAGTPTVGLIGNFTETGVMTVTGPVTAGTTPGNFISTHHGPTNVLDSVLALSNSGGGPTAYIARSSSGALSITNDGAAIPIKGFFQFSGIGDVQLLAGNNGAALAMNTVAGTFPAGSVAWSMPDTGVGTARFHLSTGSTNVAWDWDTGTGRTTMFGATSGSAAIGVAAVAGTPNPLQLPITTGGAGAILATDGGNPQQLSWTLAPVLSTLTLTAATPTGSAGQLSLGTTTATSATAGANGDVPAQVVGYLTIDIAGVKQKIPYYNV